MTWQTPLSTEPGTGRYDGPPPANYERHFVPAISAPLARELIATAELRGGERALDMACGTGVVARLAAERVGIDGAVAGVDVNPGMLAVAESIPARGAAIRWHEADAADTGLPSESYDAALCQLGLQFFADQSAALREMRRLLAPGGHIVVNVPGPTPTMFDILDSSLAEHVSPAAARFIAVVFSLSDAGELERLLDDAGFDEIFVRKSAERLRLPPPTEFLRGYISSTPLAPAVAGVDEQTWVALEREVVERWKRFAGEDGTMVLEFDLLTAVGRRG